MREQSVQSVAHQTDLGPRVRVALGYARCDGVLVSVQRQRRHLGGGRGDAGERAQGDPHDREGPERRDDQGQRGEHGDNDGSRVAAALAWRSDAAGDEDLALVRLHGRRSR